MFAVDLSLYLSAHGRIHAVPDEFTPTLIIVGKITTCSNTCLKLSKSASAQAPSTKTSSRNASVIVQFSLCNIKFIALAKVAGALRRPNPILVNSNRPCLVINSVFFLSSVCTLICQYAALASSLENQRLPPSVSIHSSIRGNAFVSLTLTLFNAQ